MDKWEYNVVVFEWEGPGRMLWMRVNGNVTHVQSIEAELQALGNEGWELVTVDHSTDQLHSYRTAYFKRHKP